MKSQSRELTMRQLFLATGILATLLLGACATLEDSLGLGEGAPDEFKVVSKPPLEMPPDFNLLPPRPGTARPQQLTPAEAAREALLGSTSSARSDARGSLQTAGELALLRKSGGLDADPDIVRKLNEDANLIDRGAQFSEMVLFFEEPDPSATVIDPVQETERLRRNRELGLPVNYGPVPAKRD